MKTFKDLKFEKHSIASSGIFKNAKQAKIKFDNGYGVSVISGKCFYTSSDKPYECAITFEDELCYTTEISDDVIGYCDKEDVSKIMKQVQEL